MRAAVRSGRAGGMVTRVARMVATVLVATLVALGAHQAADAVFHAGWTGNCDGCHGSSSPVDGTSAGLSLTPSEICLRCHAAAKPTDHQVATHPPPLPGVPPAALTPGGDFAYLQKLYYWTDSAAGTGS